MQTSKFSRYEYAKPLAGRDFGTGRSTLRALGRATSRYSILWFILPRFIVAVAWGLWGIIWKAWRVLSHDRPVPINMPFKTCLLWLRQSTYEPYRCRDGTYIATGAPVLEMHLRNAALARVRTCKNWEERVAKDFSAIASWLTDHPDVQAVVGVSIIGWAMRHFGAELRECRNGIGTRFKILHMSGLLFLYQLHGRHHVMKDEFRLFEGWISRQAFIQRYLHPES